ncbi:BlaI/MecI/CopY family transcriptional regulator [Marinicella rhabdoformis]|uniref:BlaI/MecI/CopY family transcriptional regulator n=1 Tax=Marinicella rhabdoformis TaxID=2580566 RepID=UPI0015D00312|nr:BlaI/MecI/CopY family transcriptional regulator [Marinicella rhabdoformis]
MNIAESELTVISTLWKQSPLTIGQIIERVQHNTDWHDNTIKTLVNRLLKKGHISRVKDGRQFFYSPITEENQVAETESNQLLDRFFKGKLSPLLAHFAENKKITQQDLSEIENIIQNIKTDIQKGETDE